MLDFERGLFAETDPSGVKMSLSTDEIGIQRFVLAHSGTTSFQLSPARSKDYSIESRSFFSFVPSSLLSATARLSAQFGSFD